MFAAALLVAATACTGDESSDGGPDQARPSPTTATGPTSTPSPTPSPTSPPEPVRFDRDAAMRTVRHLAGRIGPREAASPAYRRAADWVERRLTRLGYDVSRQSVRVPAGVSWGVPVEAGRTQNVIATPPEYEAGEPYRIVSAQLDTVPQAPGAEDNASGVAVFLELARMAAAEPPRLPVVFIAFGAEEPRGEGDDWHHFGSRAYVDRMSGPERRNLRAMASVDRVGTGSYVPVCSGGLEPPTIRRSLLRTAARIDVATEACLDQASDHWSFDKAGMPAVRVGGTPYAEYHSPADRPRIIDPANLARAHRLVWAWLR